VLVHGQLLAVMLTGTASGTMQPPQPMHSRYQVFTHLVYDGVVLQQEQQYRQAGQSTGDGIAPA
jgi:hypothetical protein